jgi:hypothetical protein
MREIKLHKSVVIELLYLLAPGAKVQENSCYLCSSFGMHRGQVWHTDHANNVPFPYSVTACIDWLEVEPGHGATATC